MNCELLIRNWRRREKKEGKLKMKNSKLERQKSKGRDKITKHKYQITNKYQRSNSKKTNFGIRI
jgi:hypothetical protein